MRIIRIAAVIAAAALPLAVAIPASASPAHRASYIRLAGTSRCVTALGWKAGAPVVALKCAERLDQRWIVGRGIVRLAGTKLRLTISRRTYLAVLELPRSWRDRWHYNRHRYLADRNLSRRFSGMEVLGLPRYGHYSPRAYQMVMEPPNGPEHGRVRMLLVSARR